MELAQHFAPDTFQSSSPSRFAVCWHFSSPSKAIVFSSLSTARNHSIPLVYRTFSPTTRPVSSCMLHILSYTRSSLWAGDMMKTKQRMTRTKKGETDKKKRGKQRLKAPQRWNQNKLYLERYFSMLYSWSVRLFTVIITWYLLETAVCCALLTGTTTTHAVAALGHRACVVEHVLAPQLAVIADGETVGLVAYLLRRNYTGSIAFVNIWNMVWADIPTCGIPSPRPPLPPKRKKSSTTQKVCHIIIYSYGVRDKN